MRLLVRPPSAIKSQLLPFGLSPRSLRCDLPGACAWQAQTLRRHTGHAIPITTRSQRENWAKPLVFRSAEGQKGR